MDNSAPRTYYDKLIDRHCVHRFAGGDQLLLYIDRTVINEYTSPQAFSGLRDARRRVWRPDNALAVVDHVNSTEPARTAATDDADPDAARQIAYLRENCTDFGIELLDVLDPRQGIEHVVAPEEGFVLPGMIVAAGDSHTTTYAALGAMGFGIGTSDIEHLLASSTLRYQRQRTMRITLNGRLRAGATPKDLIMLLVQQIGAAGANGHAVEFAGPAIAGISIEGRMTIANMAVELGARAVVMAPDAAVLAYLQGRRYAPVGAAWDALAAGLGALASDPDARFDREFSCDAGDVAPMVSWGISPDQAVPVTGAVPDPAAIADAATRAQYRGALAYMGLAAGTPVTAIGIDRAFIGSCTNARIEDLRAAAAIVRGRRVAAHVRAMVVPGSGAVRRQAEAEGLDRIFTAAGFEWRRPGCSMCLGMNPDILAPHERCASSTNRNFAGRQGPRGRTHLMSPAMVAAAAIAGHIADARQMEAHG